MNSFAIMILVSVVWCVILVIAAHWFEGGFERKPKPKPLVKCEPCTAPPKCPRCGNERVAKFCGQCGWKSGRETFRAGFVAFSREAVDAECTNPGGWQESRPSIYMTADFGREEDAIRFQHGTPLETEYLGQTTIVEHTGVASREGTKVRFIPRVWK